MRAARPWSGGFHFGVRQMAQPDFQTVRDALLATPDKSFKLADFPTRRDDLFEDKASARKRLKKDAAAINILQDKLYAENNRSLLVVLQGMDTSGKSGVIRNVFADTSPLGINVKAFKAPSKNELARDYLWRVHNAVPKRGNIQIFDRSHYEDVLVVRVRGFAPPDKIEQRYEQINAFEKHISENGVTVLKFMLHISHETQGERLKDRLVRADKRWKFNPGDLEDRKLWPDFMAAYEAAVDRCSTEHAPWYVVPSDSRTIRNALIARIVRGTLEDMAPDWPDPGYRPEDFEID